MKYISITLLVTTLYLLITADFTLLNIGVSLMIGFLISVVYQPESGLLDIRNFPRAIWALFRYVLLLLLDLIKSGLQVAWILLQTNLPIKPGIITISANCESEMANALSAHSISLTPGEIVVEMDEHGTMYTHVLDITEADEYTEEAQEIRRNLLRNIFP